MEGRVADGGVVQNKPSLPGVGALVWGGGAVNTRDFSGVRDSIYILIGVIVTQVYTFVKTSNHTFQMCVFCCL